MRAAVNSCPASGPGLLAVTVLTSMDEGDLKRAGYAGDMQALVKARAADANEAGMDGVVCAPLEAGMVRKTIGRDMLIVTPGVRPADASAGDQKRVMTPAKAIAAGADYLVVGRPVTAATDPVDAAVRVVREIEDAL
jgi:orotidine-5'-phosphate decarboxylase